jgi:hypothetical protein
MNIKRIILSILTVVSLLPVFLSLVTSITEPQVQANLELYLANLTLHASEAKLDTIVQKKDDSSLEIDESLKYLLGEEPYVNAKTQYQEAKKLAEKNLDNLKDRLNNYKVQVLPPESEKVGELELLKQSVEREKQSINQININLGIIETQLGETKSALKIWNDVIEQSPSEGTPEDIIQTAKVLKGLWSEPPEVLPSSELILKSQLKGWFRYQALEKLYQVQNRQDELSNLQQNEQEIARQVLIKLALINALPLLGGMIGFGILIFLLVQWLTQKKESLLGSVNNSSWQTPWDGETIWQVLVGFFFISQIAFPLIVLGLGLTPTQMSDISLLKKAIYVLVDYILIAASELLVLYFSVKSFFPLAKDWFRFQWLSNWILWGIGGYLVALPLVFVVSLANQLFWQGQGGSNPLLFLALQAQDKLVLAIFFFTASVAAPVFEEIIFRGFLLPSLTRYLPVWGAIAISSIVFAIAHLNLSEVLPLATLGIVLGVVYTRSRNLLSSILLHSLWNGGTLLSLFVLGSGAG